MHALLLLRVFLWHLLLTVTVSTLQQKVPPPNSLELQFEHINSTAHPIFFHNMRRDGAGATILNMIAAWCYCTHRQWIYGGLVTTLRDGDTARDPHHTNVPDIVKFIFGRVALFPDNELIQFARLHRGMYRPHYNSRVRTDMNTISGPPWEHGIIWQEEQTMTEMEKFDRLVTKEKLSRPLMTTAREGVHLLDEYYTAAFLELMRKQVRQSIESYLRGSDGSSIEIISSSNSIVNSNNNNSNSYSSSSRRIVFAAGRLSMALHIRRGDVDDTDHGRYTPDSYYLDIVAAVRSVFPDVDVHAFSSLEGRLDPSAFESFYQHGIKVHFEDSVDTKIAWLNMMNAHVFVMAKSSFSIVPALLNPHCIIYDRTPKWRLEHWVTASEVNAEYLQSCYP